MTDQSVFSDDFSRADESLYDSANWIQRNDSATPNISIVSGKVVMDADSNDAAVVSGFSFADDQYAEVDYTALSGSAEFGLTLRQNPESNNYNYHARVIQGTTTSKRKVSIAVFSASGFSTLSTSSSEFDTGTGPVRFRFEAVGDQIKAFIDGAEYASATNAEVTSGAPGIGGFQSGNDSLDNFDSGSISLVTSVRKSSTFDIETTLGTITTATLDGVDVFDHVSQAGTTVSFAGAATDEITTSGEYSLVLGDGTDTETITVQVNVYGVAPSNNPLQKNGSALASLTGVQVRVTDGANLNGTQLEYLSAATTDASGNLGNVDLSSTAAAVDDAVLLHIRTAAGDSIIASETVELL